jgi:hypothetical protein
MVDRRSSYRILVGKPEVETTWKTEVMLEDNIKIDLREVGSDMGRCGLD